MCMCVCVCWNGGGPGKAKSLGIGEVCSPFLILLYFPKSYDNKTILGPRPGSRQLWRTLEAGRER